jgi:hypothetical protein
MTGSMTRLPVFNCCERCGSNQRCVPETVNPLVVVVAALVAVGLLRVQTWRALLCLWPQSMRVEPEEPASALTVPGVLEPAVDALTAQGFTVVGSHSESPRLGRPELFVDLAHAATGTWAQVSAPHSRDERGARVTVLTRTEGAWVLTSNFRRPARDTPRAAIGGLEGAAPDRLVKAHTRRVAKTSPLADVSLDARVALAREWYASVGVTEVRLQHARGLMWTLFALGLLAAPFVTANQN